MAEPTQTQMTDSAQTTDLDIAPVLRAVRRTPADEAGPSASDQTSWLMGAVRFDCRALPLAFVEDTGDAVWADMEATGEHIELPFDVCYFQFEQERAVLVAKHVDWHFNINIGDYDTMSMDEARLMTRKADKAMDRIWDNVSAGQPIDQEVEKILHNRAKTSVFGYRNWSDKFVSVFGEFTYGMGTLRYDKQTDSVSVGGSEPYFDFVGGPDEDNCLPDVKLMIGVLTLLNDKLVIDHAQPDRRRYINAKRAKKNLPPLGGSTHVLTVNVPTMRAMARREPVGTHESPALHWRRGHWRTLHRGTELETRTWIKRMLVGDPDRGFISKTYKLVNNIQNVIDD